MGQTGASSQSEAVRAQPWRPRRAPQVIAHPLDEELVLYDARSGQAYVLNPTAARIWELCAGDCTAASLAEELATSYALPFDQALADVRELLDDLREAGLLVGE